jgi:hypothetical protein
MNTTSKEFYHLTRKIRKKEKRPRDFIRHFLLDKIFFFTSGLGDRQNFPKRPGKPRAWFLQQGFLSNPAADFGMVIIVYAVTSPVFASPVF